MANNRCIQDDAWRCPVNLEELKQEALCLSPEARAYPARELLASLDAMSEAELEKL